MAVTETLCPVIPFPSFPLSLFHSSPSPLLLSQCLLGLPSIRSSSNRIVVHSTCIHSAASIWTSIRCPFEVRDHSSLSLPLDPYFLAHPTRPNTRSTSCWILPSTRLSHLSAHCSFSAGTRHEGDTIQREGERGREGGILLSGGVRLESGGKNGSERGRHHVRRRGKE